MVYFTLEADTLEELEKKIRVYYNSYHPCGYGTYIREPVFVEGVVNKWVASGYRYDSCD